MLLLLLYTLDQVHVLLHHPDVVVVDEAARVAVLVVFVAVQQVVVHLPLVVLSFNLACIVKDINPTHHVSRTIVAISAQ